MGANSLCTCDLLLCWDGFTNHGLSQERPGYSQSRMAFRSVHDSATHPRVNYRYTYRRAAGYNRGFSRHSYDAGLHIVVLWLQRHTLLPSRGGNDSARAGHHLHISITPPCPNFHGCTVCAETDIFKRKYNCKTTRRRRSKLLVFEHSHD